jgi:hypothetical protein
MCRSDRRMFRESQCETCCAAINKDITIVGAARTSCRREAYRSQEEREKRVTGGMYMSVSLNDADPQGETTGLPHNGAGEVHGELGRGGRSQASWTRVSVAWSV